VSSGVVHSDYSERLANEGIVQRTYTRDELEMISEIGTQEIQRRFQELIENRRGPFFDSTKEISIFFSWVPWFLMGLLVEIGRNREGVIILALPLILTVTRAFSIYEFAVFVIALTLGAALRSYLYKRRKENVVL
ncbi:MAG: hypothetical protein Q8L60_13415, partial [Gammaproteobacteria bacterium]|nr:hypothetical protein [Gammaproteobacteria bacterium]